MASVFLDIPFDGSTPHLLEGRVFSERSRIQGIFAGMSWSDRTSAGKGRRDALGTSPALRISAAQGQCGLVPVRQEPLDHHHHLRDHRPLDLRAMHRGSLNVS